MLNPNLIIPKAQAQFVSDADAWANAELYGIKDEQAKSFSHVVSSMLMLIGLADPNLPVDQQQCFLSKLQSNN